MSESRIEVSKDNRVTCYVGPDATNLARARVLASSLKIYDKTGLLPTRGVTASKMLEMAKGYTGKSYRGKDKYLQASRDVETWCKEMAAALPVVVRET